ncbi:MAG: long-chain fatty acid--CoA ligase [Rhodospirillales bacterium 70-18]|nr:MAG: long-chain fatty acid--CoA ligase [Rhodospirillales bacterium 70-18]
MDAYPTWPNLAAMMFECARAWPQRPMLRAFRQGAWQGITWAEFARQTASVARRLRAAGVAAGDRVLIVSENRPEYPIAETALLAIRAVPVPAYTTNTVDDHAHVLRDSGARVAIVSTAALAAKVAQAGPLRLLVTMEDFAAPGVPGIRFAVLAGEDAPPDDIAAEAALIPPGALACLIYTSGTGGAPKGVMLPHRAILSNCAGAFRLLQRLWREDGGTGPRHETYLSYLPLSHSFEHTAGQFFMLSVGAEVVYSRGVEHLAADILAVRPTIMTMVPRVLEVIRGRILAQVAREPGWKRALFARALDIGTRRAAGGRLSLLDRVLDPLLERLVRHKVRARFGGRLRAAISGGARLEPEVGRFYLALGIKLLQGYGQTEAGPVIAANPPDAIRIETVGPPLEGVALRIAEDGEILVQGDLVMDGYWGRPEETAAVIRDGWLHTGDIGVLDPDGYLRITDRKKDMIVLSGGENISPARIEGMLLAEPAIAQAVVTGEGQAGLSALVVAAEGCDETAVAAAVSAVNMRLAVTERIRRHAVVPAFTIDNGLLTATQKVRRHLVVRAHGARLDGHAA